MKFTRLKLHGFKSFCDQAELVMEPGLTGVVGPNGCGKSNLVEALRWVMGESSYKAMRASGMDDVIFSGSGNRPGRNSAEVTLVLDNTDRSAPAALNTADVLEITRRIEREAGSIYRVNGREVRARDVQLLFADASTGAHSPALVRQGQIGELIAAKPAQRRALLEEAAGISGLHSRRHEAELRLRGAEQNLERVDDVVAQIEGQLDTLKRQARLAVRYKALSGEIRQAEAGLFHIRWVAARVAEKETEAEQGRLVVALGDAMHLERQASAVLEAARASLEPLRNQEAAAGAKLQRLTILAEQLTEEARRAEQRRGELADRLRQIEADTARERQLDGESAEALDRLRAEKARLEAELAASSEQHAAARAEAEATQAKVAEAETLARSAADALAQIRAQQSQARRGIEDAARRIERLTQQIAEVAREAEAIGSSLENDSGVAQARSGLEGSQDRASETEQQTMAAEQASAAAQQALDAARPLLSEVEKALSRLESEAETLAKVLHVGAEGLWPAIVDQLQVVPGFETALGAALGDDLDASSDDGAPLHWAGPYPGTADAALPGEAEPLSRYVTGSALLKRRLDQIGLVAEADGPRLAPLLRAGQQLVTRGGAVWRWDGLVAAADAPSPAAERLAQKNRLAELDAEIARVKGNRAARRAELDRLTAALKAARETEQQARDGWRAAQREIGEAQGRLDKAQRAMGDLVARRSALEEARVRLNSSLAEAQAVKADAEQALDGAGSESDAANLLEQRQGVLVAARGRTEQARTALATFETTSHMRQNRLQQVGGELKTWTERRERARAQQQTLAERRAEIERQIASLAAAPDDFAARREALDAEIEAAKQEYKARSDELSVAQTRQRDADKAQRLATEGLAGAREQLARVEERHKGLISQRHQIEHQVQETLGIQATQTAQAAGIRPQDPLPQEGPLEGRLERLRAERERLGGVNLSAEQEAEEVREKLEAMVKDRDDLIAAIAKLRAGIQSLNREGRQRLTEAFDRVNGHFRELFTTLFGGGSAELSFIENDDPLEAGLEIIARPPGKKPSTMTLLSGGEQALTAMSLIFAVFLTNPAPICVLDEVDAPLDDANVERFCHLLDSMRQRTETRFLVITHNPITMASVDRLFGVTMAERGVSQLVSVALKEAEFLLEAV